MPTGICLCLCKLSGRIVARTFLAAKFNILWSMALYIILWFMVRASPLFGLEHCHIEKLHVSSLVFQ